MNQSLRFFFTALVLSATLLPVAHSRLSAQKNLVLNPSFEYNTYPAIHSWPPYTIPGAEVVPGWSTPTFGTADFFNSDLSTCDGFPVAKARTGQGRCALLVGISSQNLGANNYKEYIQGKFLEPLEAGETYSVRFYVTLDRATSYTCDGLGAYISSEQVRAESKEPLPVVPQITTGHVITSGDGWVEISGTYVAKGGEQYITIGSFSSTRVIPLSDLGKKPERLITSAHIQRGAYFYIDDVCVAKNTGPDCECLVKKKKEDKVKAPTGDYFLFLLDISGSMQRSGKLNVMKQEIKRFVRSLDGHHRIGIMSFSDRADMIMPFMSPADSMIIDTLIDRLKSRGSTNGELAVHRACEIIDSLKLKRTCHLIIATDGIFNITEPTIAFADSVLNKNNTSFCVLQFGNTTNKDLLLISEKTPKSSYNYVRKKTAGKVLKYELPPEAEKAPATTTDVEYTLPRGAGGRMIEEIIEETPRTR